MNSILFANLIFKGLTKSELLLQENKIKLIVTVNAEFIVYGNEDQKFKKIINENYSTFDGQLPYLIAKIKNRNVYFEKISGSEFIYDACEFAKNNRMRIFLLGGNPDSNRLSVERLKTLYGIEIEGFSPEFQPYPFTNENNRKIIEKIKSFGPQFVFVGFGPPKQEYWMNEHKNLLEQLGVRWLIGSGGTFEIVSGQFKRAPKLIQRLGLERIYRFAKEPRWTRFKRLMISFKFFIYIF